MQYFNKGSAIVVAVIIVIILAIIGGGVWYLVSNKPKACTQEAKLCPDGTYVSRTGPNCEFTECPIVPGCKNLWWYDNEHSSCQGPKQFCGLYMYQGLQTFETKDACEQDIAVKDWKTYQNNVFGFSFKYPPEYTVQDKLPKMRSGNEIPPAQNLIITNGLNAQKPQKMILWVNPGGFGPFFPDISYEINAKTDGVDIVNRMVNPVTENTQDGTKLIMTKGFSFANNSYQIEFIFDENGSDYETVFQKILSTFKFIE